MFCFKMNSLPLCFFLRGNEDKAKSSSQKQTYVFISWPTWLNWTGCTIVSAGHSVTSAGLCSGCIQLTGNGVICFDWSRNDLGLKEHFLPPLQEHALILNSSVTPHMSALEKQRPGRGARKGTTHPRSDWVISSFTSPQQHRSLHDPDITCWAV